MELKKLPVREFPRYSVDTEGNIYGINGKIMSPRKHCRGYHKVAFHDKKYHERYVHRVVVDTFIGEIPKNLVVNHINGNKIDNRLVNLEIVSDVDNKKHALLNNLYKYGDELSYTKVSNKNVLKIRELYFTKNITQKKLAEMFGCSRKTISDIVIFKSRIRFGDSKK